MNARRGFDRERAVRRQLDREGWWTCRAAGSLGDADIIALKHGEKPLLIEVKSTTAGPFHSFGPKQRGELARAAAKAGGIAYLLWWPPRRDPKWFAEWEWPVSLKSDPVVADGGTDGAT